MARRKFPSDQDRYTVSLPEGMRERLKAAAKANHRTLNAEIVSRLQASFGDEPASNAYTCSGCGLDLLANTCRCDLPPTPPTPNGAWDRLRAKAAASNTATKGEPSEHCI